MKPEEILERLEDATSVARGIIREAHAATKDLRKEISTAERLFEQLTREALEEQTRAEILQWRKFVEVAVNESTEAVYKRFETLSNVLLGTGKERDLEAFGRRREELRKTGRAITVEAIKTEKNGRKALGEIVVGDDSRQGGKGASE